MEGKIPGLSGKAAWFELTAVAAMGGMILLSV
jgi:hypothetical protein